MDSASMPEDRRDFKIAIICALSLEADMVEMIFDKNWSDEGKKYGKAAKDSNAYTTGVIAGHNVVLAYCPGMGKNAATQVATSMKTSFTGIRLALVVGICGAVPFYRNQEDEVEEIVLGDCIISTSVVQFDFGRLGPAGFQKKDGLDSRGLANAELRGLMAKLKSRKNVSDMTRDLKSHLEAMQKEDPKRTKYAGHAEDRLYEASYIHTHHDDQEKCQKCSPKLGICNNECKTLGCSDERLIARDRLSSDAYPQLHFGCFGSSDTVVKSGLHRDELAEAEGIIAFEMEGSGVWDIFPTIVVKAACDYADSHKNKKWQSYAAAVAASTAKALINKLELADEEAITPDVLARALQRIEQERTSLISKSKIKRFNTIPFPRDKSFVGRSEILDTMVSKLQTREPFYQARVGLVGMGGIGKSQIVIEYAYRLMETNPNHSVFWIFAANSARFEQSYTDIALQADLKTSETLSALQAVHRWLSHEQKDWTLILDNLDSDRVLIESSNNGKTLMDYLPITDAGTIIVTSRSRVAASDLVGIKNVLLVAPMDEQDSIQLLRDRTEIDDEEAAKMLIRAVEGLPLAIAHAGSFIASRTPRWTVSKYLESLELEKSQVEVLYKSTLSDNRRDSSSARTIQATFQISFIALLQENPDAANLLSLMSMFQNQHIPEELLDWQKETDTSEEDRIDILEKYSLVVRTSLEDTFSLPSNPHRTISIHRAVHMSLRLWLETKGELEHWQSESIIMAKNAFPVDQDAATSEALARRLLPHAEQVVSYGLQPDDPIDRIHLPRDQCKVGLMIAMIEYWQHVDQASAHQDFCKKALDISLRIYPIDSTYNLILGRHHSVDDFNFNSRSREKAISETRRFIALAGDRSQEEIYFILRIDIIHLLMDSVDYFPTSIFAEEVISLARNSLSELNKATMDFWPRFRYDFALLLAEALRADDGNSYGLNEAKFVLRKAIAEKMQEGTDSTYWELTSLLASICKTRGDLTEARKLYSKLVKYEQETYECKSQEDLKSRDELAQVFSKMGKYRKAAKLWSSLVDDCIRISGEKSSTTLAMMKDHAVSVFKTGRRENGLKILQRADILAKLHLAPTHKIRMEITRCKASILERLHRWKEAEVPWSVMLAAQRTKPSPEYPSIVSCLFSLIPILEDQEKWEEAEQFYRELIESADGEFLHVDQLDISNWQSEDVRRIRRLVSTHGLKKRLFENLIRQAKWEEARATHLKLMFGSGYLRDQISMHPIDVEYSLSLRLIDAGARDHALVVLRSALAMALAEEDLVAAKPILKTLIDELEEDEKCEEAEPLYRRLLDIGENLDSSTSDVSETLKTLSKLANNLIGQLKFSEAEIFLHRVSVASEAIYEGKGSIVQTNLFITGSLAMIRGRYKEAVDFFNRSLPAADPDTAKGAQFSMGIALYMQDLYAEAEETFAACFRNAEIDQSEKDSQERDDNIDAKSWETYEDGKEDIQWVESRVDEDEDDDDDDDDEYEDTEPEESHDDENRNLKLIEYNRDRSEDNRSGNSENEDQDELARPKHIAIWLYASIRAQHEDPSTKCPSDLQPRFDAMIVHVRETPVTDMDSLKMPLDHFKILRISHELSIQNNDKAREELLRKHGITKHGADGSATEGVASSQSSSEESISI